MRISHARYGRFPHYRQSAVYLPVSMLLLNVPFLNGVSSDLHRRMRFYALEEGLLPPVKTSPLPEGVLKVHL